MNYAQEYLAEVVMVANRMSPENLEQLAQELIDLRERRGRLFIVGLGGSAANASHACSDFRKLMAIDAYCLTDNIAEITARANDEGWHTIFDSQLARYEMDALDALLVFSVGGASEGVSLPIKFAVEFAKQAGARVLGVVGRDGGYTAERGDVVVIVPTVAPQRVTPHTEAFHMIVLHYLASHPDLQRRGTKW